MRQRGWTLILATLALVGLSVLFTMPFAWMASTSLKVDEKIQSAKINLLPTAFFIQRDGESVRVRPLMVKEGKQEVQILPPHILRDGRIARIDAPADPSAKISDTMRADPSEMSSRLFLDTDNYGDALKQRPFGLYLLNTLIICCISVVGTLLSCSLIAYGLSCVEWRGRELLFWLTLATMMLPGQVTMIPLFLTFKQLGWINSIFPLTVPTFFGNAFFIFLLRQFYRSIPKDLIEAARMDGCSDLGIWAKIMVPLSRPALAVVALFTFITTWNDFLGPLIYLMDERKYTLAIGLAMFQGQYGGDWGQMMAMSLMMTVPIVVLFFFTQKTFIQGVKLSGIKG